MPQSKSNGEALIEGPEEELAHAKVEEACGAHGRLAGARFSEGRGKKDLKNGHEWLDPGWLEPSLIMSLIVGSS